MLSSLYSPPACAATLPRGGNSGKSKGGFLGPSKAGCRLIRVDVDGDLGSTFCGKPIGQGGNKMCLQKDCEIATHAERPYPTCFTSGDVVLIQAPNGHEAFLKPAVYAGKLQPNLERYLQEERSKESWESLLTNLDKTENVTSEEMANFENRIDTREREYPLGVTPLKKRVKLDLNSPTLDAGFEVTVLDLVDDLGANDSMVLSNLREQWRLLGQNLRTLKELQEGAREGLRNLSSASAEEFARVNLELSRLDNRLGERNEDAGTMAAFNMIAMLWEERSSHRQIGGGCPSKGSYMGG